MATLGETEKTLYDECHELAANLQKFRTDPKLATPQTLPSCTEDIKRHRLKTLQHENAVLDKEKLQEPIKNPLVISDNFLTRLDRELEGCESYAEILKNTAGDLQTEIEQKCIFLREQEQISDELLEDLRRFSELEKEDLPPIADKIKNISEKRQDYRWKMRSFLDQHFPAVKDDESGNFVSMRRIIAKLLDTTPDNPYIKIEDDFWPPHIEALLRFNICCRHPDKPSLICLFYTGE